MLSRLTWKLTSQHFGLSRFDVGPLLNHSVCAACTAWGLSPLSAGTWIQCPRQLCRNASSASPCTGVADPFLQHAIIVAELSAPSRQALPRQEHHTGGEQSAGAAQLPHQHALPHPACPGPGGPGQPSPARWHWPRGSLHGAQHSGHGYSASLLHTQRTRLVPDPKDYQPEGLGQQVHANLQRWSAWMMASMPVSQRMLSTRCK